MGLGNSIWGQASNNGKINFNNVDWDKAVGAGAFGAVTSYGSAAVGGAIGPVTSKLFGGIASPVLRTGLTNAVNGAVIGSIFGAGLSLANGQNTDDILNAGFGGAMFGAGTGLAVGSVSGYVSSVITGRSPWDGKFNERRIREAYEIPDGWQAGDPNSGQGVKFTDPKNPHNHYRFMEPKPNSRYESQQEQYIRFTIDGKAYDANGNLLPSAKDPKAHIPPDFRYIFNRILN